MLPRVPKNQDENVTGEPKVPADIAPTGVVLNSGTESTETAAVRPAQPIPVTSSTDQTPMTDNIMCDSEDTDFEGGIFSLVGGLQIANPRDAAAVRAALATLDTTPRRSVNFMNNSKGVKARGAVFNFVGGHQIGTPQPQANRDE